MLTNAAATHLEGFGDLAGVVRTKGEIIDGLVDGGVAILNADDAHFSTWQARAAGKAVCSFGFAATADVRAEAITHFEDGHSTFTLVSPQGRIAIRLALAGEHNVRNALAAAGAALAAGASLQDVQQGLEAVRPVSGRLTWLRAANGARLIDDSYNASPSSFRAAIEVLAHLPGRRVLIVGDMGELGHGAEQEHLALGQYAREKHIDVLWATGALSALCVKGFGPNGRHFDSQEALVMAARAELNAEDVALVKGSRSAAMDRVVAQLQQGDY